MKKMIRRTKGQKGFTILEIIIVLGIMLVLSAGIMIGFTTVINNGNLAAAKTQVETIGLALNVYYLENREYPTTEQGLDALWEQPSISPVPESWNGPYIDKKVTNDPWGNPYVYQVPGPNNLPFSISSLGADKKEGGTGTAKDINSWEN